MARNKKQPKRNNHSNTLRIIGGDWRSRKLTFIDAPGLRPTPDRIRETLFNWLQGKVYGSRCLDLFAGSGALGLEALSRGASDVVFIEKSPHVAKQLESNLAILKSSAKVQQNNALDYLGKEESPFDIIFLDPPYRQGLLEKALNIINQQKLLHQDSFIYLEHEAEKNIEWGSFGLEVLKQSQAGQVNCFLLKAKGL